MNLTPSQKKLALYTIIFFLSMVFFGMLSVWLGQDGNFDLSNYHFYNPYAFLNGRLDFDFNVSQFQAFSPPTLDLPFYWLATTFSAKTTGFFMGVLHGLSFWLIFLIAKETLKNILSRAYMYSWSFILAAIGFAGSYNLGEHGLTFNDNLVGLFVLGSLLLTIIFWNKQRVNSKRYASLILAAGLVMGLALGLKLTASTYVIGLSIPVLFISSGLKNRLKDTFFWSSGVVMGFLTSYGYWMYYLWVRFSSPVFPFYNSYLRSPYNDITKNFSRRDHWAPDTLWETITLPFQYAVDSDVTTPWLFSDGRWAVLFILLAVLLLFFIFQTIRHKKILNDLKPAPILLILSFIVVSYVVWIFEFAHYRYLLPLELLPPLAIFLILLLFFGRKRMVLVSVINFVVIAILIWTLHVPRMARHDWNSNNYFVDQEITIENPENTMVILVNKRGVGHLVPFFSPEVKFVRVDGNWSIRGIMREEVEEIINNHEGVFLGLTRDEDQEKDATLYKANGFSIDYDACINIVSSTTSLKFLLCSLEEIEK